MGIPIDLYTPIFAMSRAGGWIGHVLEQYDDNRLIRPRAKYTGSKHVFCIPLKQLKRRERPSGARGPSEDRRERAPVFDQPFASERTSEASD
jgi:hypothetical protein